LEDNAEDNGDVEDKSLYCFCQKLSYGESAPSPEALLDELGCFRFCVAPRRRMALFHILSGVLGCVTFASA